MFDVLPKHTSFYYVSQFLKYLWDFRINWKDFGLLSHIPEHQYVNPPARILQDNNTLKSLAIRLFNDDLEKILELQTKIGRCHGTPSEKRNSAYFQMDFENLPETLKYIFESYLPEEESVTFFVERGLLDFFKIIQKQNDQNKEIVCLYFKFLIMNHFAPFSSKHRKSWSDFHEIFLNGKTYIRRS